MLTGQHPKLRERCIVDLIVSVLEDTFGAYELRAYDAAGVLAVLADRRDEVPKNYSESKKFAPAAPLRITALWTARLDS